MLICFHNLQEYLSDASSLHLAKCKRSILWDEPASLVHIFILHGQGKEFSIEHVIFKFAFSLGLESIVVIFEMTAV